jgi:hypothetical protein
MPRTLVGRVIPWLVMSDAERVDHLRHAHGFVCYEQAAEDPWLPLERWTMPSLSLLHQDDHDEYHNRERGLCDAGPLHHDHTKERVRS